MIRVTAPVDVSLLSRSRMHSIVNRGADKEMFVIFKREVRLLSHPATNAIWGLDRERATGL